MRICYLTSSRIPSERAYSQAIMKMCEALADVGNEVIVLSPRKHAHLSQDAFAFHAVNRTFVHRMVWGTDFLISEEHGRFSYWIDLVSFLCVVYTWCLPSLARMDVIYTRELIFLPLRLLGVKVILESHALPKSSVWYMWWSRFLSGVVVISGPLKQAFVAGGVPEKKILVAPSGVDLLIFRIETSQEEAREVLELPAGPLFVYTGNFTTMNEDKGINTILSALQNIPSGTFVGVGAYTQDIERYTKEAQKKGVEARVLFRGRESQARLALYQRAADVLLMPFPDTPHYRNAMSPIKMFEYMASGRPIIATDLPTIREVLHDGNAYIIAPGNPEALARTILEAVAHINEAGKKSAQALHDVENYSWQERARRIVGFIS